MLRRIRDALSPPDHRGARKRIRLTKSGRRWAYAQLALMPVVLLSCFADEWLGYGVGYDGSLLLSIGPSIVLLLFFLTVSGISIRATWPGHMIRLRLRQGDCGACGYYLGDLPPEMDGCTPCPECGAAWRVLS